MDSELVRVAEQLERAKRPEDIFGSTSDQEKIKKIYRKLAMATHEDRFQKEEDKLLARAAFKRLHELLEAVKNAGLVLVQTKKHEYLVGSQFAQGDVANLYLCSYKEGGNEIPAVFKVARDDSDNDLLSNEAEILRKLQKGKEHDKYWMYVPILLESLSFRDSSDPMPRQVNIFSLPDKVSSPREFYSLAEVRDQYRSGVDPKDFAWIFRRVLVALGFAHVNGIIHGAVLPPHILVHPKMHGVVLIDWKYAVSNPSGNYIKAISSKYEAWYPRGVFDKKTPVWANDISMAARCMTFVLGGDPLNMSLPNSVPASIRTFLGGCLSTGALHPWDLLEEFDELIKRLWGERKFHPFSMPERR
jgi:serine/threonine protein kinase